METLFVEQVEKLHEVKEKKKRCGNADVCGHGKIGWM